MYTRSKLLLAGLGATVVMAFAMTTATARTLSLSNQNFRWTFNDVEMNVAGLRDDCRVTFEGSFHARTINKVLGSLIGYITRNTNGQCTQGTTILSETLPWHVRYEGFSGILPNITLLLFRIRYVLRIGMCLHLTIVFLRIVRNATGALTEAEMPTQEVPLTGFLCPETGTLRSNGNGSVTVLGSATRASLTLI